MKNNKIVKVHLGCAANILPGWINIDFFYAPLEPNIDFVKADITDKWPFESESVQEILSEHVFEHFGFADEERLWHECYRVLEPGGLLTVETPDLVWSCQQFIAAKDDFKSFYKVGAVNHYFGQNSTATDNRWSLLTTTFFGNQNGPGQFHRTGYTAEKFYAIAKLVGFTSCAVTTLQSKGGQSIRATLIK